MYSDVITLFNRFETTEGIIWYPTILRGVDLNVDKAAVIAKYGEQTADNALLHVKCKQDGGKIYVGDKLYLPPKLWALQERDSLGDTITFASGTKFDFFILGEWDDSQTVDDNAEEWLEGFYNYINKRYDYVFSISGAALYSVIPHFEIAAK